MATQPIPLREDDWLTRGATLRQQAIAILENPDTTPEQLEQVDALTAEAEAAFQRSARLSELRSSLEVARNAGATPGGDYAPAPSDWRNFGEFLHAIWVSRATGQLADTRLLPFRPDRGEAAEAQAIVASMAPAARKDLAEAVGATGGFLVPTEFQAQLLSVAAERAIIRPRATVIRMRNRSVQIPVLDQTGTSTSKCNFFGGIQVFWAEEAAQKTESEPAFRQIELVAHKLIGYTRASDELLADSAIALADFFNSPLGFTGAIAWEEDYRFLTGTGAGMPLGIVPAAATITAPRAVAGHVNYDDVVGMLQRFLPGASGMWVASQSVLSDLALMSGPAGNPAYVWLQDASGGIPGRLLGYPIMFTEKLPLLGSEGDILLIDPAYYLIGDRQATTVEATQFDRWREDQTSWRAVHRVDGQPWLSAPLTFRDGTTQVSPFVKLGAGGGS